MTTKRLSPSMEALLRALRAYGYVDAVRDLGRVANSRHRMTGGTIVALMDRGYIREQDRHFRHWPATTPEEVWEDALKEAECHDSLAVERARLLTEVGSC